MARILPALTEAQFRKILMAFAVTLAIAGIWTLFSELGREPRIGFPIDQNYQAAADQRWKAALAARVGMVRGDLWAELFFSFANSILIRGGPDFGAIETLNEASTSTGQCVIVRARSSRSSSNVDPSASSNPANDPARAVAS